MTTKAEWKAYTGSDCVTASSFSKTKENHVINARPKAEEVHARTYQIGAVSYDLK